MRIRGLLFIILVGVLSLVSIVGSLPPALLSAGAAQSSQAPISAAPRGPSLLFIENIGQSHPNARFVVRGGSSTLWLAEDALWVVALERSQADRLTDRLLQRANVRRDDVESENMPGRAVALRLSFLGANRHPRLEPFERLETAVSYFRGNEPSQWHTDVPVWGGVRYKDLYPGVDLEVSGDGGRWTWQFAVRDSQFAISSTRLRVEGAKSVAVDGDYLRVTTTAGEFTLPLLTVQGTVPESQRTTLGSSPVETLHVAQGTFDVAAPFSSAPSLPLSVSPQDNPADLLFGTFLGGSDSEEEGYGIAVDAYRAVYVAGHTWSSDFPTTPGAFDRTKDGYEEDAFVVKVNPTGTALAYATFLGGSDDDYGFGLAVDGSGAAYVSGLTDSADFPTTQGADDTSLDGNKDAFVAKLNATGTALEYATYLGGGDWDSGNDIALGGDGAVYITGWTFSNDFPTTPGALDTICGTDGTCDSDNGDAFVTKLNSDGTALEYATFLGGSKGDLGNGIAVDTQGAAYVTGNTNSADFPTTSTAFDTSCGTDGACNAHRDGFVVKLNPAGSALEYATFLGGGSGEDNCAIAVDGSEEAYVTGFTSSADFPTTPGAFDTTCGTDGTCNDVGMTNFFDVFAVKLNPAGSALEYATFLGGEFYDWGWDIAVDESGVAYIAGGTGSINFPSTADAFDPDHNGRESSTDTFVVQLNAAGSALEYATFLGGSDDDRVMSMAVDKNGSAYITGRTRSSDFPTSPAAFDTSFNGGILDAFVVKLAMGKPLFSVTGQVLDGANSPIEGVWISANATYSATTDANGIYNITDLLSGTYNIIPTTPGYFWLPRTRTVTGPPDATDQDFTGRNILKESAVASQHALDYGEPLTYTLRLIAPEDCTQVLYDRVPTYTAYISGSLSAPAGVAYHMATSAISGALTLTATVPATVTFAVRVGVTGTVALAPLIVNRACVYPVGRELTDCKWSNEVRNFTYVWSIHLPLVMKNYAP